jgi:hypothetical protein
VWKSWFIAYLPPTRTVLWIPHLDSISQEAKAQYRKLGILKCGLEAGKTPEETAIAGQYDATVRKRGVMAEVGRCSLLLRSDEARPLRSITYRLQHLEKKKISRKDAKKRLEAISKTLRQDENFRQRHKGAKRRFSNSKSWLCSLPCPDVLSDAERPSAIVLAEVRSFRTSRILR